MKLTRSTVLIGLAVLVGVFSAAALFLYALLFSGSWHPFLWVAGLSATLIIAIKVVALISLEDTRQLWVTDVLVYSIGGAVGWTWIALLVASGVLLFKALFAHGAWSSFFLCALVTGALKWLTVYCMTTREALAFEQEMVARGMSKADARKAWIARAQEILAARKHGKPKPPQINRRGFMATDQDNLPVLRAGQIDELIARLTAKAILAAFFIIILSVVQIFRTGFTTRYLFLIFSAILSVAAMLV